MYPVITFHRSFRQAVSFLLVFFLLFACLVGTTVIAHASTLVLGLSGVSLLIAGMLIASGIIEIPSWYELDLVATMIFQSLSYSEKLSIVSLFSGGYSAGALVLHSDLLQEVSSSILTFLRILYEGLSSSYDDFSLNILNWANYYVLQERQPDLSFASDELILAQLESCFDPTSSLPSLMLSDLCDFFSDGNAWPFSNSVWPYTLYALKDDIYVLRMWSTDTVFYMTEDGTLYATDNLYYIYNETSCLAMGLDNSSLVDWVNSYYGLDAGTAFTFNIHSIVCTSVPQQLHYFSETYGVSQEVSLPHYLFDVVSGGQAGSISFSPLLSPDVFSNGQLFDGQDTTVYLPENLYQYQGVTATNVLSSNAYWENNAVTVPPVVVGGSSTGPGSGSSAGTGSDTNVGSSSGTAGAGSGSDTNTGVGEGAGSGSNVGTVVGETAGTITGTGTGTGVFEGTGSWILDIPILGTIVKWLSDIWSLLSTFFGNLMALLQSIWSWLQSFFSQLIGAIATALQNFFLPTEAQFTTFMDDVNTAAASVGVPSLESALAFSGGRRPEDISITVYGQTVTIVPFGYVETALEQYFRPVIRGLIWFLLVFYEINNFSMLFTGRKLFDLSSAFGRNAEESSSGQVSEGNRHKGGKDS